VEIRGWIEGERGTRELVVDEVFDKGGH